MVKLGKSGPGLGVGRKLKMTVGAKGCRVRKKTALGEGEKDMLWGG